MFQQLRRRRAERRVVRMANDVEHPRPFGAHLALSWWKPVLVLLGLPAAMIALQMVLFAAAELIEGPNTQAGTLTPLQFLAVNLSMGITGVLAVPVIAYLAQASWREVLSFPRRFDFRRLSSYLGVSLVFVVLANAALGVFAPDGTPWIGFGATGTTVALAVIAVLTTPLTAAGEELMFRGAIMPAVASWVKPVRPALALGVVVSSLFFAVTHGSTDPWLFAYHGFLGLSAAAMAILSRGLEASIAWHVANNTFTVMLNIFLAAGGTLAMDRSEGAGGPHLLIPVPFVLAIVAVVWLREWQTTKKESHRQ